MGLRMLLPLDLQKFSADGGEFGGYDPSTAYEGIGVEGIEPSFEPQVQPEGQGELVPEYQEPPVLDFGGRRLQANEDLMGLHKDFTEQQRYITALQEQVNAYKMVAQQIQPQAQPQQPQQVSSNVEEWNEDTWQKFYDNPQDVLGNVVQSAIQQFAAEKLDPILQERHWQNEIQNMYNKYPDFDQYVGTVQTLIDQYPDRYADRDGGLEEAYFRAVATSQRSPQQMAQDPQFLNQYVYNNPNVQGQVIGNYLQNKQQTNQQLPTTMGRGAGGFTPQTPEQSPQTLREASRGFLKQLGYR